MKVTAAFVLAGLGILTGCSSEAKAGEPPAPGCASVAGTIGATVTRQTAEETTVQGTVTGTLEGSVVARISRILERTDGSLLLTLAHDFVTVEGALLSTTDEATLTPVPGQPNVFQQLTTYTVVSGTGRFDGVTGQLTNHGEADLARGRLTLIYEGSVCGVLD